MKLLVISHSCAAAVNQELYAEVQRITNWEIALVVPSNWKDEYGRVCAAERWPAFRGELVPIPVRQSGNIILHTYRRSFAKLIREVNPDVVYVNHEPYAAATAQIYWGNARAGDRPVRRPIGFYSCQNICKRYPPPFRQSESWVLRSSAFAFPISSAVADVFRSKGYRGHSSVLPLAIDSGLYQRRPDAEVVRRELIGTAAAGTVLLGYVGRLVPEKGLATLVTALGRVRDLPWRLVVIGAGPMEAELKQSCVAQGIGNRITFMGFVPHVDTPRFLAAFDALVLPSETQSNWREQFGRVLLEAMACGTPVVGSDSGEIPVIIRDTGGGLIFRERDPASLSNALQMIITDSALRHRLAEAGAASVASRYTIDSAAKVFAETIKAVMADTPHGFAECHQSLDE